MHPTALLHLGFALLICTTGALSAENARGADHARIAENLRRDVCEYDGPSHQLSRRATVDGSVGADVTLPSVGLSLGNITTKLGNINLTVTNVTISVGDVDVENIQIGNITVIVSVPLPGASPINAFGAYSSATSMVTSTASPTSTVSPGTSVSTSATTATGSPGVAAFLGRRQDPGTTTTVDLSTATSSATPTSTSGSAGASATVSANPITLDTGSVYTEIGNISIFVGHVNVSIGNVKIKNVTLGNIVVLVQIGQPDLNGHLGNVTNTLGAIGPAQ